ncbi:MAG: Sugar-specific transcriptional regulator TrmB [Parcubacteria group bacterium ADurb.Bin326]|nr:MAG: Sugar-specific transcriptional regulator TrmB [Parcubacteria group bacterium ADurb.Bin326]
MLDEKEKNRIIKNLTALGLNEKEATVYLSLFVLGEVGSSKIINETGLHGQYVYDSLNKLEEKGLIQHIIKRGRKKFIAKNPETITRLISLQQLIAQETTERLKNISRLPEEQKTETFVGNESWIANEFNLIEKASVGAELRIIGGQGDHFSKEMGGALTNYESIRDDKKIIIRYIGSLEQCTYLENFKKERANFHYRLLPGMFTGLVNTNIWPNIVNLNLFGDPVTSFVIYNQQVAESYGLFFEVLWKLASDIDCGRMNVNKLA